MARAVHGAVFSETNKAQQKNPRHNDTIHDTILKVSLLSTTRNHRIKI